MMTMLFGVAANHPAATVAARIAYLFATDMCVERVVVWRGSRGNISVRPYTGRECASDRIIGIYRRDVTIAQVCEDVAA